MYYPGWQTPRKIVVFESDDWGSLSIPTKEAYHKLHSSGIKVDGDSYCKFDGLARPEDLRMLFDVLTSYRDKNERHPVITANSVVANPDFTKIRASNFEEYHYELFTDTLKRYKETESSFDLWEEGMSKQIFFPQFHGREHLHVRSWMGALQLRNKQVLEAFKLGAFGVPITDKLNRKRNDYRAAFDSSSEEELGEIITIVSDGLDLFEKIFNYRSLSIIAPCYTWNKKIESSLHQMGISLFQGIMFQKESVIDRSQYKKRYNYLGKKNKFGQYYSVRNLFFEPTLYPNANIVQETLRRIKEMFDLNKPAIIGTHRLNFIGSKYAANRDKNLKLFSELLQSILIEWPDVEFMTTAELGNLIARNDN